MKLKTFCFDLDNTLCYTKKNHYHTSKPSKKAIETVNYLYDEGHRIKIYTARYMGRNNDNIYNAKRQGYNFTKNQLDRWGLKYNKIFFGKPSADIYIDDKAIGFNKKLLNKYLKKFI